MTSNETSVDLSQSIGAQLPFLRRYARALTGSQFAGDNIAAHTLEAILRDTSIFDRSRGDKEALFSVFHDIWRAREAPAAQEASSLERAAQKHMRNLTPQSREALLLSVIEGFTVNQIASILSVEPAAAAKLIETAYQEMEKSLRGKVMIIEDEAIIAVDLEAIVDDLGHAVTGVARTRSAAVKLADDERPDLILSDIQLADNSSGIDAVNDILTKLGDVPVIFITAFPERLLTGERHEPAFLIPKPYTEDQVRVAVSQAMFFASTETLKA